MIRIITGKFKGRKLSVLEGRDIRPTTDRMRERVFSMLGHHRYPDIHRARVADIFAGTGALGLEALSRGASHVSFVEKSPASLKVLETNIAALKVQDQTQILKIDAQTLSKPPAPFDIIFLDPPYRMGLLAPTLNSIIATDWLSKDSVIIAELASDDETDFPESLDIVDERTQGQQRIVFLMQN